MNERVFREFNHRPMPLVSERVCIVVLAKYRSVVLGHTFVCSISMYPYIFLCAEKQLGYVNGSNHTS